MHLDLPKLRFGHEINLIFREHPELGDEVLFDTCLWRTPDRPVVIAQQCDMFDVLVAIGAYPSKGQARKNWRKTGAEIPQGFNSFVVKRIGEVCFWLNIWNPVWSAAPCI